MAANAAVNAGLDVFTLLTGSAYAINGSSAIAIPGLNLTVPNVLSSSINLNVVERPQAIFGHKGIFVDTQQATVGVTNQLLPNLGAGVGLLKVSGTVTLRQSVAGARGTLNDILCGTAPGIVVGVTPQPVATTADLVLSITLLGIEVARVNTGLSATPVGQSGGGTFGYKADFLPPVGQGTMVEAPTSPLGLANLLKVKNTDVTVLGSLGLGVTLAGLVSGLNTSVLNPLLANLDAQLTGPISTALGLSIGSADVGALDMTCNAVRLVG